MGTLEGFPTPIGMAIVPGGVVGAFKPVPGINTGDTLIEVKHVSGDLVTNVSLLADFTITDADEVTNGGAVDTTGNFLIVVWKEAA